MIYSLNYSGYNIIRGNYNIFGIIFLDYYLMKLLFIVRGSFWIFSTLNIFLNAGLLQILRFSSSKNVLAKTFMKKSRLCCVLLKTFRSYLLILYALKPPSNKRLSKYYFVFRVNISPSFTLFAGRIKPHFDERNRIYELDSCNGSGKVCLVYKDLKAGTNKIFDYRISKICFIHCRLDLEGNSVQKVEFSHETS